MHRPLKITVAAALLAQSCLSIAASEEATADKFETYKKEAIETGLTVADVEKYNEVMSSHRGIYYKRGEAGIYAVLAAEAKDDAERMRLARLWVQSERDHYERLGAAVRAYTQASVEAFGPSPKVFDMKSYDNLISNKVAPAGRSSLYVYSENCSECIVMFKQLDAQRRAGFIAGIDIYFVDAPSSVGDVAIRRWASSQSVSPDDVKSKSITLNYGASFKATKKVPSIESQ